MDTGLTKLYIQIVALQEAVRECQQFVIGFQAVLRDLIRVTVRDDPEARARLEAALSMNEEK